MKKLLFVILICLPISLLAQIKEIRTGWRIGFGSTTFETDNFTETPSPKLYIQGGGMLVYRMTNWGLIRADLQMGYTSAKGKGIERNSSSWLNSYEAYTDTYQNLSLSLPLAIRIGPPLKKLRPYIEFGAMAQANLLNTEERVYESNSYNDKYGYAARKMEEASPICSFGIATGGLELHTEEKGDFFLEFRYLLPLSEMGRSDGQSIRMKGFTIGGGIIF